MPVAEVREKLIAVFERWGKPGAMRVDNGAPFGDPTLMTTPALSLWLIAVDIDMIWNKPHCPEQNGQVEKMQDTTQRWAEVGKAAGPQHLQKKLDEALGLQRESYPVERLRHQTRLQAFPALEISRRPYVPSDFAVSRVYAFLCRKIYIRKVAANGQIGHYGQLYYLGCALRHQWVQVRLSTDGAHWQVFTTDKLIKELPATHLTEERIQNLTVGQRTNSIS